MSKSVPWFLPDVGPADLEQLAQVVDSNYINDGNVTREFERKIAEYIGVKFCVGVTSGTAAITLALMGFGIGPGDEVIVPDLTFIATANAVKLTGADVKLVDIEPERFTLDPERLQTSLGPRTRAVVTVDVNGRGADYQEIEAICREHDLRLVCDSAEALGSKYRGRHLGTYGDAGCFSFSPNKTVTCGQGGMIATKDKDLYHRLLELKDQGRRAQGTGGDDMHPVLGYNFKLTNLQAAVGLAQFNQMEQRLKGFINRDNAYANLLAGCPGLEIPPWSRAEGEIRQWMDILVDKREKVRSALVSTGIGCRAFWFPLHTQKPYAAGDVEFRNAIGVSKKGLWLPSYFGLSTAEIEKTCRIITQSLTG